MLNAFIDNKKTIISDNFVAEIFTHFSKSISHQLREKLNFKQFVIFLSLFIFLVLFNKNQFSFDIQTECQPLAQNMIECFESLK